MAQINPVDERLQFQSSAQAEAFSPYQVANPNAGIGGKLSALDQSFELAGKLKNSQLQNEARNIERLAAFSNTLSESMQQGAKFYSGYEEEQANLLFAEDQRAQQLARTELENNERVLKETDALHAQEASNLISIGAPPEIVQRLKELGGLRGYYYKRNAAVEAGRNFKSWLVNELTTDTTKVTIADRTLPINSTEWEPQHQAAILKIKLAQYYKEYGLDQISRGVLAKYTLPEITEAEGEIMGSLRKAYAIRKSDEDRLLYTNNFFADLDAITFVNNVANTYDERGNPIGRSGSWKMLGEVILTGVKSNQITATQAEQLLSNTIDPVTNKPIQKSRKLWAFDLMSKIAAANRENWQEEEADNAMRADQFEKEVLADFNSRTDVTEEEIHMAQKKHFEISGGKKSDALETYQSSFSVTAEGKRRLNEQFKTLAEQGLLTPDMVRRAPWDVKKQWESVAEKQADATDQSAAFKTEIKSIEMHVKSDSRVKVSPDGSTSGVVTLIVGELQAKFRRKVAEYIATGDMTPQQAAKQAVGEVFEEFNTASRYATNNTGEFSNFMPKNTAATSKALNTKLNNIRTKLRYGGKASLDVTPGLMFDKAELQAMERGYGQPGWSVPPVASYWASQLNMNPLEIINRQRTAAGLKPLATPASIDRVQRTISPGFQALLNRYQSPNRSIRGLGSGGQFDPTLVKSGYGNVVQKAAQANGIDPAILAGLIETESGWNPNAVSKAGARGIAQIMPQYHPGVNVNDPIASINYAAKYLSKLQRQFGGDMKLAIIAYNAGPGNVEKYRGPIPGDSESGSYYSKVLKASAKYGYGAAWRDRATMRGKFRVTEYLTGDPNHEGYRADHGGGNYHEHIAFATKAERDAAIRKLNANGIQVGSIDRPGDPGNHGKGLAIDVPASQVPVGKEKELSRRVRSILGLS